MKKLLLFGIILALLTIPSCGNQTDSAERSVKSSAKQVQETDFELPGYLTELTDWEKVLDMDCTFSRDDLNIQIPADQFDVVNLAECLLEMNLAPYEETENTLDVPHPFTLIVTVDGKDEMISITEEKVSISGRDYFPAEPGALYEFYKNEHYKRFLSGDVYLLGDEMSFTAAEVAEIMLEEHENYSDGVTTLTTTVRAEIDKIVAALDQTVARRIDTGEETGGYIGIGGNGYYCTLTLRDGSQWRFNPRGLATVTSANSEEDVLIVSMDHQAVFGLVASGSAVVSLEATIEGMSPTMYEKAYQIDGQQKSMTHLIPIEMYFDADPVLRPKDAYTCRLKWTDDAGNEVNPVGITATLYQEDESSMQRVDEGIALKVADAALTLPGNMGRAFVVVRAQLPGGSWVESIFSYRSTIFPTAFYDISYGNDEGGVVLTRNDIGVSVTGTQNRKYVNFIMGLELLSSNGEKQNLPVRKPFTMTFSCDNKTYEFVVTKEGVTYDGELYMVGNPKEIEDLYIPFDLDDAIMFERIDYNLRGFLTKDVAYFTDMFPFGPEQIEKFTIIREEPEQRIWHEVNNMEPQKIMEILGHVVLGNGWKTEDYYLLRRFYLSYAVVLKDGTVYEIGEKILKNGEETNWYTIQSDSPLAARHIEGRTGAAQQRETPIFGGITTDVHGNIVIE